MGPAVRSAFTSVSCSTSLCRASARTAASARDIVLRSLWVSSFCWKTAFAMRGVEIMMRTATLFSVEDVKASARFHDFYSAMSNITFPTDSPGAPFGGNSLVVSPDGKVLGELPGNYDGIVEAVIPKSCTSRS